MLKNNLLNEVLKILTLNEFRSLVFRGSFDVLAKKDDTILIKVLTNIDSLTEECANNIKIMSNFLSAKSFAVSIRTNRSLLTDNVIYYRFGVPILTLASFNQMIKNDDEFSSAFAIKGKHLVKIDVKLLKEVRESKKLSLDNLSKRLHISKKSLYEIESERVDPTKETSKKLEDFFEVDLSKKYEIGVIGNYKKIWPKSDFEREVCLKFSELNIQSSCLTSSPFEIVGKKKEVVIVGLSENMVEIENKSKLLDKISEFTESIPVFITKNSGIENINGVPIILNSEMNEINDYNHFSSLIKERK